MSDSTESRRANALAREKSPYLLQHAYNPVDWLPWGDEAFRRAQDEDKPIFLSVGYSTCHWCHVMEHESFENEDIARLMNDHFVNIKVDREERPDVDLTYMSFVQATTGQGGWPMSVWLTPDLKPIVGGTYFPPSDLPGRAGFPRILSRVAELWKSEHDSVVEQGERVVALLREEGARDRSDPDGDGLPEDKVFATAAEQFSYAYDSSMGGFSVQPKFPRPATFNFLFRFSVREKERESLADEGDQCLRMALVTLKEMACGGVHDHLGGGFHRYSVDRYWHVPHFEKMLYDQPQLAVSYLDAYLLSGTEQFREVAENIFAYVLRDLRSPGGGFYSAEDADSFPDAASSRRVEGAFYTWTAEQLEEVLGRDSLDLRIFSTVFGVKQGGNVRPESDPLEELRGVNVPFLESSAEGVAEILGVPVAEVCERLEKSRQALLGARGKRPRPRLDDKIITAWNGLMISGLARGYQVLSKPEYLDAGAGAANFVRAHLVDRRSGGLIRSHREGPALAAGFASDYAFFIQGLLDLYEASLDLAWLRWALELQERFDSRFLDAERGGYFSVSEAGEDSIVSIKEEHDGAEPAPNSVAALNLLRLGAMTGASPLREQGEAVIKSVGGSLKAQPISMPQMAVALDFALGPVRQIVLVAGADWAEKKSALLQAVHAEFRPRTILVGLDSDEARKFFGEHLPALREMKAIDGKTAAYVCRDYVCQRPVTEAEALAEVLG